MTPAPFIPYTTIGVRLAAEDPQPEESIVRMPSAVRSHGLHRAVGSRMGISGEDQAFQGVESPCSPPSGGRYKVSTN